MTCSVMIAEVQQGRRGMLHAPSPRANALTCLKYQSTKMQSKLPQKH
jgi:hypothetical protein